MYILKQIPEDFIVKEKSIVEPKKQGRFTYFLLRKKKSNTIDALKLIAKKNRMPLKKFGFAGNKDKTAVTEQICSVQGPNVNIKNIHGPVLKIIVLGRGDRPVSLGDLEGNYFEIMVRNVEELPKPIDSFTNYFGEQRFGTNNIEIGKALVKKEFEKACLLVDQDVVKDFLENNPTNFIAALRQLPKRLLRLYVHSYQSFFWNKTVKELVKQEELLDEVPIIGFDNEIENPKIKEITEKMMAKEGIDFRDFIIKEFPEISSEGSFRKVKAKVKDLLISELEEDELNQNKKKFRMSFFLDKGCYATEFIRQLFA